MTEPTSKPSGRLPVPRRVRAEQRRAQTAAVAGQVLGVAAAVAGVYLLAGLAVALIVAGVLLAAWATLREAGWV